jgi:hypothetical protein
MLRRASLIIIDCLCAAAARATCKNSVAEALDVLESKDVSNPERKHGNIPL